jgi:putative peptidoglycan lipid II flippase
VNRVIAPAFYARGDTKTPTLAGLISVGVNIGLAFFLVGPLKAPGIALALAGASAVNAVVLMIMLIRARIPGATKALAAAGRYSVKLLLFSCLAAVPVFVLRPFLNARLSSWNVNLSAGISLAATFVVFGVLGIGLLAISRDGMAAALVAAIKRRRSR